MKETQTIDVEPTWTSLGKLMVKEQFAGQLDGALNIADIVRQAQKRGDASVTFKFREGKIFIDDGKLEKQITTKK